MLNQNSEIVWSRFVQKLVIWTQPSGPLCLWQCLCLELGNHHWILADWFHYQRSPAPWKVNIQTVTINSGFNFFDRFFVNIVITVTITIVMIIRIKIIIILSNKYIIINIVITILSFSYFAQFPTTLCRHSHTWIERNEVQNSSQGIHLLRGRCPLF